MPGHDDNWQVCTLACDVLLQPVSGLLLDLRTNAAGP
jgi:hypothetical protein